MAKMIAISDCDHAAMAEEREVFSATGYAMDLHQCKTEDDLIAEMQGVAVMGNQYAPLTERVFANLPDLQCVVRYGVGVDHIDIESATRHGVKICNVPDYGVQEVALQAFTMALALHRKLVPMNASTKAGAWNYERSIPIQRFSAITVGVVGIGRIGRMFAGMLVPLGCRILVWDPLYVGKQIPDYMELVPFESLIESSDIVSIHTPLEATRNLFAERELRRMKPTAYLVNVSRGGIVNEADLLKALENGWIAGAASDVFVTEPPGHQPLLGCDNFIATPHMAWYSEQASKDLKRKVAEELVRAANGHPLRCALN
jgi:D-3-phosphoglycerate dehydrogenase